MSVGKHKGPANSKIGCLAYVKACHTSYIILLNTMIVIVKMKQLIYDLFIKMIYMIKLTEIELYTDYDSPDNQCFRKPRKYHRN